MADLIIKPSHTGQGVDLIFEKCFGGSDSIWFMNEEQAKEHVAYMNRDNMVHFNVKLIK